MPQRDRLFLRTVVVRLSLGFKIAWRKGARGRVLDWIGAVIRAWMSPTGVPGVVVTIAAERIHKLNEECCYLLRDAEQVQKSRVRQLAGLATWISGVMPRMCAFTNMLWAAINSGSGDLVSVSQLRRALLWISTLCGNNLKAVERHCRPRASYFSLITFDGSLTGGGATLQVGLTNLKDAEHVPVVSYWHDRWTAEGFQLLGVEPGDPGGQARLEAYTLLGALATWQSTLAETQGTLAALGDALGILYDVTKIKAKEPVLNAIAAEMALLMAPIGMDIRAANVWTQRNRVCDELSRLQCGQLPELPTLSSAHCMKRRFPKGTILQSLKHT